MTAPESVKRFRVFLVFLILILGAVQIYRSTHDISVFYHRHVKDPGTIKEYFANNKVAKLQLGAGRHQLDGWLNSDIVPHDKIIYLDATAAYPFADGSFHFIFTEHLIEHLTWEDGVKMLKECYRVLAPGGRIRIVTPDLGRSIHALRNPNDPEVKKFLAANRQLFSWPDTPVAAAYDLNRQVREWGHEFIYDSESLRKTLELVGFKNISEPKLEDKTDPAFEHIAFRTRDRGEASWNSNSFISMALEAER